MTSAPIQLPQPPETKGAPLHPDFLKKGMRLGQFKPDQVWMIKHPKRVVRIVEENTVELRDEDGVVRVYPCLVCEACIPTVPIPEHVTGHDAQANKLILAGVQTGDAIDGREPGANQSWKEIWAERQYPGVVMRKGFPAPYVEDGEKAPRYPFATVVHVEGRSEKRENTSPIQGSRPVGVLLKPEIVSPAVFGDEEDAEHHRQEEAVGEGTPPVEARPPEGGASSGDGGSPEGQALPSSFKALVKLAGDRGVDVSDIRGPGSVKRLQERLSA